MWSDDDSCLWKPFDFSSAACQLRNPVKRKEFSPVELEMLNVLQQKQKATSLAAEYSNHERILYHKGLNERSL